MGLGAFDVAGLAEGERVPDAVRFFFYDSMKIGLLLAGIVFAVGVLRSFMRLERTLTWSDRSAFARAEVKTILGKVWPYLLVGIALGAAIYGWMPQDALVSIAGSGNPLAVPAAVLMGVPLYSNAAGVLPLIEALHAKGIAMGTRLASMMSVVALSLPEMVLLRRVLRLKLIAIYVTVVASSMAFTGLLFNAIL